MNAMLQLVSYNMHQNDQSNALAHDANVCMAMSMLLLDLYCVDTVIHVDNT